MGGLTEGVWKYYLHDGDSGFPHWLESPLGLRAAQKDIKVHGSFLFWTSGARFSILP